MHWIVYVLVPPDTKDVKAQVALLLGGSQTRPEVNFPIEERSCACGFGGYATDPECEICNGTGIYRCVMDPYLYWEEWQIGGRFEGRLDGNQCLVRNIPDLVHASDVIVTPDGVWHESAGKGLPLPSTGEEEAHWNQRELKYQGLLDTYPDHLIVVVDAYD